jgi:predicted dehydrogenase
MAATQPLRVGYVGAGWADRVQIPIFAMAGLQPQAIAAGRVENARRVAQAHAIPEVYATWQELVEAPAVDLISIVTPPRLHREIAEAALAAGKHVLCEKPTALNTAEAEAMLAAAQRHPTQLALIDHELRFHPRRVQMRRLLKEGFAGEILTVHMDWLYPHRLNADAPWTWQHDAQTGGGILGALGSHLLDQARWMIGRIDALTARLKIAHYFRTDPATGTERQVTADDHADLLLQFNNGVHGTIRLSALAPGGSGMSITVVGTAGALWLDSRDRLWGRQGSDLLAGDWTPVEPDSPMIDVAQLPITTSFAIGTYHLAQVLAQELPAGNVTIADAASFYDGLVVQRALDAARRSHEEQIWVHL